MKYFGEVTRMTCNMYLLVLNAKLKRLIDWIWSELMYLVSLVFWLEKTSKVWGTLGVFGTNNKAPVKNCQAKKKWHQSNICMNSLRHYYKLWWQKWYVFFTCIFGILSFLGGKVHFTLLWFEACESPHWPLNVNTLPCCSFWTKCTFKFSVLINKICMAHVTYTMVLMF